MAEPTQPVLRFDRVSLAFGDNRALDDLSFSVEPGQSLVIFGAAGSGKTVLLKTAIGLLCATAGHVEIFGQDVTRLHEHDWYKLRARVGVLFQEGGLFDSLNIEENVSYPLANLNGFGVSPEEQHRRAEEALRFVELEHTLDKFPSELSGGMRRRVGIARAVVTRPQLVLYDSPTAGLDPITAYTIVALILKERELRNTTTVMATHRYQDGHFLATAHLDPSTGEILRGDEARASDRRTLFLVLREGRLAFLGTLAELHGSDDPYLKSFVKRED